MKKKKKKIKTYLQLFAEEPKDNIEETNKSDNYFVCKTKEEFNKFIDDKYNNYKEQINNLESQIKELKSKDIDIKNLKNNLNIFKQHILDKYQVKNLELSNSELNFNSYNDLEKSILKILEKKQINYKKDSDSNYESNIKKQKVYL